MIDEAQQEKIARYILGELNREEADAFRSEMTEDAELRRAVEEIEESFADLALSVPPVTPPPEVLGKVLQSIHRQRPSLMSYVPWAIAACLAIACGILGVDRMRVGKELTAARQEQQLASLKIATLQAQVEQYARTTAVVVWDPQSQRGIVRLTDFPPAEPGKDYQLWVIGQEAPAPVSAGVVKLTGGRLEHTFNPVHPVPAAAKFAISVEKTGGSTQPEGQIIAVGEL
jgi:anti-sigma-K factor RskA